MKMSPYERAVRIALKLHQKGTLQVRFWNGMFLTYPFPVPRGYGTRGVLVGIYTTQTPVDWIAQDITVTLTMSDSKAFPFPL